jgi:hypothetical protein
VIRPVITSIGPDDAAELLATNAGNRRLNPRSVQRYASDMAAGRWRETGEAIKVGTDGRLLDGQHRLAAIIHSGVTVSMLVICDVDPTAAVSMDQGVSRTMADQLTILGEKNARGKAAVGRLLYSWDQGRALGSPPARKPSFDEIHDALENWPEHEQAVTMGMTAAAAFPCRITAAMLGLFGTLAMRADEERARAFLRLYRTGAGMDTGHPILHLRNHLTGEMARGTRENNTVYAGWLVQAWVAFTEDRTRKRYTRDVPLVKAFPGLP